MRKEELLVRKNWPREGAREELAGGKEEELARKWNWATSSFFPSHQCLIGNGEKEEVAGWRAGAGVEHASDEV